MEKFECRIQTIVTFQQTEEDGDELLLKYNKKKIWPAKERYHRLGKTHPKIDFNIPLG